MSRPREEALADPFPGGFAGRPDEVPACPTGLAPPLGVEKLEGRQESGRDEQDEAEENVPE
ncbi:MAG: hypothetical protein K2W96_23280 [Gemmataceae bacterium]|nr:hypothetical protein [Gemmataceae bacterium]